MSAPAPPILPRVPIVLGVVGHRALRPQDEPALREAIRRIIVRFQKAYPHTPLVLLSALAEGADQLAAAVALENGAEVRAPLPFPESVYAASTSFSRANDGDYTPFGQRSAEQMLRWVRGGKVDAFVVPMPDLADPKKTAEWQAKAADQTERRRCYANAGGYIVRHCHVLLALWDGDPQPKEPGAKPKVSGTAEFVHFKLNGTRPSLYPPPQPLGFSADRGPVLIIHTPRGAGADGLRATEPGHTRALLPNEPAPQHFSQLTRRVRERERFWRRVEFSLGKSGTDARAATKEGRRGLRRSAADIVRTLLQGFGGPECLPTPEVSQFCEACTTVDDFNADAMKQAAALRKRLDTTWKKLALPDPPQSDESLPRLKPIARLREIAAGLAGHWEERMKAAQNTLFAAIFTALIAFHLYGHWPAGRGSEEVFRPGLLALYLGSLAVAAFTVVAVWWCRGDERRLDYRALAEAFRVRCHWALAGIDDSVADSYLSQLRGEMAWARRALRNVCPPPGSWRAAFERLSKREKARRLCLVRKEWVAEQKRFFEGKVHEHHGFVSSFRSRGFLLALAGWALSVGMFWNVGTGELADRLGEPMPWPGQHPHHGLLIWSGTIVIAGGFLLAICERRSHEQLAKQYERMRVVFTDGLNELRLPSVSTNPSLQQDTLRALGLEAIAEHAQWLILRRSRPFELHIA